MLFDDNLGLRDGSCSFGWIDGGLEVTEALERILLELWGLGIERRLFGLNLV
jgi:hypothetical protein